VHVTDRATPPPLIRGAHRIGLGGGGGHQSEGASRGEEGDDGGRAKGRAVGARSGGGAVLALGSRLALMVTATPRVEVRVWVS
jgi:hypothetical protein